MKTNVQELIVFLECVTSPQVQRIVKAEQSIYSTDLIPVGQFKEITEQIEKNANREEFKDWLRVKVSKWRVSLSLKGVKTDLANAEDKILKLVDKHWDELNKQKDNAATCFKINEDVRQIALDIFRQTESQKYKQATESTQEVEVSHHAKSTSADIVGVTLEHLKKTTLKVQEENRHKLTLKQRHFSSVGQGAKTLGYGALAAVPGLVYAFAKGLLWVGDKGIDSAKHFVSEGVKTVDELNPLKRPNYQGILSLYETYLKVKPIFGTDNDLLILAALKNETGTTHEREMNKLRIAQVEVVLSDASPAEFIRQLNNKLLGLEQEIWKLAVQPGYKWNEDARELLAQLMGLLLCIEQTNRDISVHTLENSDSYQTNDAWWKIFGVISALLPGLLAKVAALNYLSHLFGSSGHISGFIGNAILKAIGGSEVEDASGVGDNEIRIQTSNVDNSEIVTGALLTSGLAVEAFAMIVATRISYMNYASATDAFKNMIQQAEKTATEVVERCGILLKDRLNGIDRALPQYDQIKLDEFDKKLQLAKPPEKALKLAYLGVRKELGKLRSGNNIKQSNIVNLQAEPALGNCIQLLQCIALQSENSGNSYPSISDGIIDLSKQFSLLQAAQERDVNSYQSVLQHLDGAVNLPTSYSVISIEPQTNKKLYQDNHLLDVTVTDNMIMQSVIDTRFKTEAEVFDPECKKQLCATVSDYMLITLKHGDVAQVAGDDSLEDKLVKAKVSNANSFSLHTSNGNEKFEAVAAIVSDELADYTRFKLNDGKWYQTSVSQRELQVIVGLDESKADFQENVKVMLFKRVNA